MLEKPITYFGHQCRVSCDGNCQKAWGINCRPTAKISEDEDDFAYLADDELETAPIDPGTYEGACGKPIDIKSGLDMNKWCVRQCERSIVSEYNETPNIPDFSKRVYNIER